MTTDAQKLSSATSSAANSSSSHSDQGSQGSLVAIGVMCAAVFTFATMDVTGKLIIEAQFVAFQMLFVRGLFVLPVLMALIIRQSGLSGFRTAHPKAHFWRGLVSFLTPAAFFTALGEMPLADATVIFLGAPVITTALAVVFFKEKVGWMRISAILVGMCGVVIAMQPGTEIFEPISLLAAVAAVGYSIMVLIGRWLSQREGLLQVVFYNYVFIGIFSGIGAAFTWKAMAIDHLQIIALMAALSFGGHMLMTKAYQLGEANVVAPFQYTGVIWSVIYGIIIWGDVPGVHIFIGAAVIVSSGLFILYRETRKAKLLETREKEMLDD
jgi:drug/metabolite transporter (DMT)-like permease